MDCSPPSSCVHGDSPGKNTEVGCHPLLQGIFPAQGSNPGLLHCRQILYQLSHQRSPVVLWVAPKFNKQTEEKMLMMVVNKKSRWWRWKIRWVLTWKLMPKSFNTKYSWSSISLGSASTDSTNNGSKWFKMRKNSRKFQKAKLELATYWQLVS